MTAQGAPVPPDLVAGRIAAWAAVIVIALVAAVVRIDVKVALIGHLGAALVPVIFLYAPSVVAWRRHEDLVDYGFHAAPVKRGLVFAGITMLIAFPLFAAIYVGFFDQVCSHGALGDLAPPGLCKRYLGVSGAHAPHLTAEFVLVQYVVAALPEELFFRGCLLMLLEKRFPPKRRWLGGGIGWALVLSSLAFGIVHIPKDGLPHELVKFFPGLLFGWLRSATGSILAGTLVHGTSNVVVQVLETSLLR
ncbi:MAG: CPBP family intramembrane metalloprotease [Deltaproteobacteria bacterium]|nr:CPBP family intramembrane metalloprotease [Deltaproteobacteria bacterium]